MSSDTVSTLALRLESDRFDSGLRHSQTLMRRLGQEGNALTATLRGTAAAMAGLVVGSQAIRLLGASIHAASAYREDLAQFEHVMRNVTQASQDMVKTLTSDAYGRTSMQARQMLMGMTSLAKGMGMTDKAAVELSGEFSKMAIDIGSFMMVNPDNVMGAFQSALMGNTMALRSYGVFLNETTLKETVAANAKKGLVFASERQARAYAVLTETQKQQADAIGDYAVEAANFGNQLRKFQAGLSELPAKFGAGLLEPANEFLKAANGVIDTMRQWDESTWKTLAAVTALGTGAALLASGIRIGRDAWMFYQASLITARRITEGQTAATGASTGAIMAETAALHANTAARTANAAMGAVGATAAGRFRRTPLPYQDRQNVWEEQRGMLRSAHSRVNNEIAVADTARRAAWLHAGTARTAGERQRYRRLALSATDRVQRGERRRDNLERNMQSLNAARRRNPLHLTERQRSARRAVMRENVSRGRYARAQRTFSRRTRGIRRSPLGFFGRGVGSTASAVGHATGLTMILRSFGSMVMRWIPAAARVWGGIALRAIGTALLPLGGTVLAALNPVGWAATILTGIAAVGNYLPTLMYKAYDGLMSVFSAENFGKVWEFFKSSALSVYEWLGKGLYGIGQIAESIFYTAVNALGNGLRRIIQGVTLGAVDIGKFEYQSSGYAAYDQQKKTDEMQAALNERRAEHAKREKQIAEFRTKTSEKEREWLDKEEALLKKRSELAEGRFDSTAKAEMLAMKLPLSEALLGSIDGAMKSVGEQLKKAEQEYLDIIQSGKGDETVMVDGKEVARKDSALDRYHAVQARYDEFVKQKEQHGTAAVEQRYALFDARVDQIGQMKNRQDQMGGYSRLLSELRQAPMLRQQEQIQSEWMAAQTTLAEKQQEYNALQASGDAKKAAAVKEEIEQAQKRVQNSQAALNELQANLSDQRKVQEKFDALQKEQEKRYKEAQESLWTFNFDHAGKGVQQQMARRGFFEAHNRFEGARSDDERETALQDMQSMYSRMENEAAEMPAWNGFIRSTAGAIESDSVAAQELQERILNDFNKVMLDNVQKQTLAQEIMRAALQQIVKNTDPNQQGKVGGHL